MDGAGEGGILIYGGTLESLASYGLELINCYAPSVLSGIHFEATAGLADAYITGSSAIAFEGCFGDGVTQLVACQYAMITDSYLNAINIDSTCSNITLRNVRYHGLLGGYVKDGSSNACMEYLVEAAFGGHAQKGNNVNNGINIAYNGGLETWSGGLPLGFSNFGYSGPVTITQTGLGLSDTNRKFGNYAAKITGPTGTYGGLRFDLPSGIRDQWISVDCWMYQVTGTARLDLWLDGGAYIQSIPGDIVTGTWQRFVGSFDGFVPAYSSAFLVWNAPNGSILGVDSIKIYVSSPDDPSKIMGTSLGINTQSPAYDADVVGTGRFSNLIVASGTTSRALVFDSTKSIVASIVPQTQLEFLSGSTSNIQSQINGKQPTIVSGTFAQLAWANVFTNIAPLTTVAEAWIGPSIASGIYFKGGFIGIGYANPAYPVDLLRSRSGGLSAGNDILLNLRTSGTGVIGDSVSLVWTQPGTGGAAHLSAGINGIMGQSNGLGSLALLTARATNVLTEAMRIDDLGNIGIGTPTPNASALLDMSSTTAGFRPPQMTTTQKSAISSPPAGLVIYDTTLNKLCVCVTGSVWQTVTSS
jgi:hypothetical protein